ncbi:MAG: DMT family transporter [Acidimicrobiales bacterium]
MAAVLLALAAALCNSLSTIFQRIGVESAPADAELRWKLIAYVLHRPIWFLGFVSMIGAFIFQAAALSEGGLTLVQPLLVCELVFLVIILRVWFGHPLGWREAVGVALAVAGLATFLAVSDQGGGNAIPSPADWIAVVVACAGVIGAAVGLTRFGSRPWRSAWFGVGAAVSFALGAAFMKSTTTILQRDGIVHLFFHFEPYAIAAAGLSGLFLTQNAFHAGPITASQAAIVIVDPIVSIAIGVSIFGDNLRGSFGALAFDAVALLGMSLGLFLLCHSPLIVNTRAEDRLSRQRPPGMGARPLHRSN